MEPQMQSQSQFTFMTCHTHAISTRTWGGTDEFSHSALWKHWQRTYTVYCNITNPKNHIWKKWSRSMHDFTHSGTCKPLSHCPLILSYGKYDRMGVYWKYPSQITAAPETLWLGSWGQGKAMHGNSALLKVMESCVVGMLGLWQNSSPERDKTVKKKTIMVSEGEVR